MDVRNNTPGFQDAWVKIRQYSPTAGKEDASTKKENVLKNIKTGSNANIIDYKA